MNKLNNQRKEQKRKLIERVNLKLKADLEKTFEKQDEVFKLGEIIKYYGIEDIGLGRTRFGKPTGKDGVYHLESELNSLFHIDMDYQNDFFKFHTKYNPDNPFRIELSFEKEDAPEGTIAYIFGKLVMSPYKPAEFSISEDVLDNNVYPRYAIVACRPEKIYKNEGVISKLTDILGYQPTQIRFGNEFKKNGCASLVLSRYVANEFFHICKPRDKIIETWGFLIPGLKESFM